MKQIFLIRHCKADGQEPDARLTIEGQSQAHALAEYLDQRAIDYLISSPYDRAIDTIRPLARSRNLPIHQDDRLRERVLSARPVEDWLLKLRESFRDMDLRLPGGESSREAMTRGVSVIDDLLARPENRCAVVTHGNLMALILKHYDDAFGFDQWRQLTNPDVFVLEFAGRTSQPDILRIWK